MKRTIKFNGDYFDISTERCIDCPSFAVYLDLGNGRPECIGYVENEREAVDMAREELEKLALS